MEQYIGTGNGARLNSVRTARPNITCGVGARRTIGGGDTHLLSFFVLENGYSHDTGTWARVVACSVVLPFWVLNSATMGRSAASTGLIFFSGGKPRPLLLRGSLPICGFGTKSATKRPNAFTTCASTMRRLSVTLVGGISWPAVRAVGENEPPPTTVLYSARSGTAARSHGGCALLTLNRPASAANNAFVFWAM